MDRRSFLISTAALAACGLTGRAGADEPVTSTSSRKDVVTLSPDQWRTHLTPPEFDVLREQGTERAFTGDLWDHHEDGVFTCAGCGLPLFDSKTKFESGTGWPSYYAPIAEGHVGREVDRKYGMTRTEVHCDRCGGHLGHVFPDGPKPTGLRYCINSASLDFVPRPMARKLGLNPPVKLGGYSAEEVAQ